MNSTSLIALLKDYCLNRSIELLQEFKYIDRNRNGFISGSQFRRFFSNVGFPITDEQFSFLVNDFRTEEGSIDVRKFISAVDNSSRLCQLKIGNPENVSSELYKLFRFLRTENTTLRDIFRPYEGSSTGFISPNAFFRELGYSEGSRRLVKEFTIDQSRGVYLPAIEAAMKDLAENPQPKPDLSNAAAAVLDRGYDVNSMISQRDRYHTGRITPEAFAGVVSSLSRQDVNQITKYYMDCDGLCDAKRFSSDLMGETNNLQQTRTLKMTTHVAAPPPPPDAKKVTSYIVQNATGRHIRISDYLGNSGMMTRKDFANALGKLNMGLSAEEINSVSDANAEEDDVDVSKFLGNFPVPVKREISVPIDELKDYLRRTHKSISRYCMRCDRRGTGEIDINDLCAVLNRIGFSMNNGELNAIVRDFGGSMKGSVQWKAFAETVEPPAPAVEQKAEEKKEVEVVEEMPKTRKRIHPFNEDIIPILQKINAASKVMQISAEDELRDADSLRCGFVNKQQFYDALSFASLSSNEFRSIFESYPDGKYAFFVNDLKDPRAQPQKNVQSEMSEELEDALRRLKGVISVRSITVFDILGGRQQIANRAMGLLSKYTPESKLIVDSFRDRRRPELVDTFAIQNALEKVEAIRVLPHQSDKTAFNQDILMIHQKFNMRHINVRRLFAGCDKFISFEEFIRRIEMTNIIIDIKQYERLQYNLSTKEGVDWESFARKVEDDNMFNAIE